MFLKPEDRHKRITSIFQLCTVCKQKGAFIFVLMMPNPKNVITHFCRFAMTLAKKVMHFVCFIHMRTQERALLSYLRPNQRFQNIIVLLKCCKPFWLPHQVRKVCMWRTICKLCKGIHLQSDSLTMKLPENEAARCIQQKCLTTNKPHQLCEDFLNRKVSKVMCQFQTSEIPLSKCVQVLDVLNRSPHPSFSGVFIIWQGVFDCLQWWWMEKICEASLGFLQGQSSGGSGGGS